MEKLTSNDEIETFIKENDMTLIYFSTKDCSVCHALLPKVKNMLLKYHNIKSGRVEMTEVLEATGKYSVFTIPTILVFIHGKETIRKSRHLSIYEIEDTIKRYYEMIN